MRTRNYTIRKAQRTVDDWIKSFGGTYWSPLSIMARLSEEVGETARLINHLHGDKKKKPDEPYQELGLELADILYTIICLANSHGIDLQTSFDAMMKKYQTRDKFRFSDPSHEKEDGVKQLSLFDD